MKRQNNIRLPHIGLVLFFAILLFSNACQSSGQNGANTSNVTPEKKLTEVEKELKYLKTADFDYIFAIKRKDGEPLTSEDKKFVKDNSHYATNRFTLTKDEKVVFAGSNYKFSDKQLKNLKDRFEVDDFSKSERQIEKEKKEKSETNTDQNNSNADG